MGLEEVEREAYKGRDVWSITLSLPRNLGPLGTFAHLAAKLGRRFVLVGSIRTQGGQRVAKCLTLAERGLIRYFLSEGHDLVNKQGTRLSRHEINAIGNHPKRFFPGLMFLEKTKGE